MPRAFQNYIGGEWVDAASGETFESLSPATGEVLGTLPEVRRRRTSTAPSPPRRRPTRTGGSCRRRRRAEVLYRFANLLTEREGLARRPDEPRDGQGARRGRRRRAGGDRHEPLHGRRGPAHVRADDALRAARQVHDERADADRRRRRDHALELPDRDPRRGSSRRRSSAATPSSSSRPRTRRCWPSASSSCSTRPGCPKGVRQHRARLRRDRRRRARAPPRRARDHLHRLARDGNRSSRRTRPTTSSTCTSSSAARTRSS